MLFTYDVHIFGLHFSIPYYSAPIPVLGQK